MTSITLDDGNSHSIESKGSGAQRAVFLSLMQYISQNSDRNIIWGIDEPEVFLQPRLQRKVFEVLKNIVENKKQPVILTTHSQCFVSLNNLSSTHLFEGVVSKKDYKRKPGEIFFEINTRLVACVSEYEKATKIKNHLGINNNDGWEVLPFNILVEGEEDKRYLETMLAGLGFPPANIIWSGGASKIGGYLQYYNHIAKDLSFKPVFRCIFDNDNEGRDQEKKIKPSSYSYLDVQIRDLPRFDGAVKGLAHGQDWEIEDFLPPELMIKIINKILKKDGYKQITRAQITARSMPAHIGTQILIYSQDCAKHNNSSKPPFILDDQGRKKQLCQYFCKEFQSLDLKPFLNTMHFDFLSLLMK